jgi:hypothetical protein
MGQAKTVTEVDVPHEYKSFLESGFRGGATLESPSFDARSGAGISGCMGGHEGE